MKHLRESALVNYQTREQSRLLEQEKRHPPDLPRPQKQEEEVHLLELAADHLLEQEMVQIGQIQLLK